MIERINRWERLTQPGSVSCREAVQSFLLKSNVVFTCQNHRLKHFNFQYIYPISCKITKGKLLKKDLSLLKNDITNNLGPQKPVGLSFQTFEIYLSLNITQHIVETVKKGQDYCQILSNTFAMQFVNISQLLDIYILFYF